MSPLPFILVLISAVSHAYWNFLVKRSEDKDLFVALCKITEIILFFIPFIYFMVYFGINLTYWYFIFVASLFVFLNYFFLAKAYKFIDLSLAYPISRSSIIFLPFIAYYFINETINLIGILAVILVTIGVFVIHFSEMKQMSIGAILKVFKSPGTLFALLAAFTVASYTVWDKVAIRQIHPFLYFYLYTFFVAVFYGVQIFLKYDTGFLISTWTNSKRNILQVAFFNTFTYVLVLIALGSSKATYVGALRQLSLIVGIYFGWKYLYESITLFRIIGVVLIFAGGLLTLFAK